MANRFQFALPDPRPRDGWGKAGNLDLTTTAIMVIAGVASMFLYAFSKAAVYKLAFHPVFVRDGEIWRLFTWPIANPPTRFWVLITLAFFWFIGHAVEELVGKARFLGLVIAVTIVPALFVTLLPGLTFRTDLAVGLSLIASVMFVIFAAQYPHQPFLFGIPAWVLAAVFIGIDVLQLMGDRRWGTLIQELAAVALGLVIVRQWGFVDRLSFIPQLNTSSGQKKKSPSRPSKKPHRSSAPKVVNGPWADPSAPTTGPDALAAQAELDDLLDKISASGLDSLTADEKRRLNELSKRLR